MVTRRAKRFLFRGIAVGFVVAVLGFLGTSWAYSSKIDTDLVRAGSRVALAKVQVLRVGQGTVTLSREPASERPGSWGLEWEGGYASLGPVMSTSASEVTRSFAVGAGRLRPGLEVSMDSAAYEASPADAGVPFEDVIFEGPLGDHAAWQTAGTDDSWVILVHERAATRRQVLRLLPILSERGFPTLSITYRGDLGAPPASGGGSGLGEAEWPDVEAAVRYALTNGAQDVVLVGFGSAAYTIDAFVAQSGMAPRVKAVVLDSPLLDPETAVDEEGARHQVPGALVGGAKLLASLRFGIDWEEVDLVDDIGATKVATLVVHGGADPVAPIAPSERLAAASPKVQLQRFAGAGHAESWNFDPDRYRQVLGSFVDEAVAGPSDMGPYIPEI